ncbi:hypothetical protein G6321_00006340 [Bradyrhizobium barranii subsp. barranii]|uniref:TniB protein n=1 Tax=Bradyrhizobium barranii subsp. barranii TaxID=2823807 RepID=A0A7Z0Q7A6_9BRAD|nr:hypothetical protein [Bradyrhizobium barranii]UGX94812.1 hypothetical protein G6321_00006340 [Bradyrhizobium barranii subsp. barranii]
MTNGTPLKDAGDRFDRLHQILLEHPRLDGIRNRIHWLMQRTESMIAKTEARRVAARLRPIKTEELWILPLIGPSGAMKSTSIAKVTDEILADPKYSDDQIPTLVVSMHDVRNPKDFVAQILDAYGDAGAEDALGRAS